jgi:peptidoglycan/LPS O-acetylase OafA/YrhL
LSAHFICEALVARKSGVKLCCAPAQQSSELCLDVPSEEKLTTLPLAIDLTHRPTVRNGRWEFLDALRGIAALLVVLQHSAAHNHSFSVFSARFCNAGEAGVVTFFLVSGYIIPVSLERYGSAIRFWIGRAFRLLPAYWLSFALIVALKYFQGSLDHSLMLSPKYFLGNLTMTQSLLHTPYGLDIYWTLSYEAIFYVLGTILYLLHVLRYSAICAIAGASLLLIGNLGAAALYHQALSAEKVGVIATAFIGTLLYRYSEGSTKLSYVVAALAVMAPAVLVANWLRLGVYSAAGAAGANDSLSGDISFLVGYLLFGLLFFLRERKFPPLLMWLGRISYSVYLSHVIVLRCLPSAMQVWLQVLLTFVITLIVASLSHKFIEQPALAVQRRLFPHKSLTPHPCRG